MVAAVVALAVRARPSGVLASALVAVAAGAGDPVALGLAALAAGAAVALAATVRRRAPVVGAVMGGLVVHAALRFDIGGFHGAESVAAVGALGPLVVSGWRHLRGDYRRRLRQPLAIAAGAAVVAAVGGGVGAATAGPPALDGVDAARDGLEAARGGDTARAATLFEAASEDFETARARIEAPWSALGRLLPVGAQHVDALRRASRAGERLSVIGSRATSLARLDEIRVTGGAIDARKVRELAGPLEESRRALRRAEADLSAARSSWLVAPAREALDREAERLERATADADVALDVVRVLPSILGDPTPRRYFLAVQQPAEARGSGGIIGNYGELAAAGGRLTVEEFGTDGELNAAAQRGAATLDGAPADYLRRYARFGPERVWQNVTASPDFPTVAEVVRVLYPRSGGDPIDGVVSVDPTALGALLQVTGPLTVAPWPEPLTSANVEQVLYVDQYVRFPAGSVEERKQFLSDVAEAVVGRLTAGDLPPPAELVRVLAPMVRGRHLQLASFHEAEQALFERIGAAGALDTSADDYLAVVNQNAGGNKLDAFLHRSYRYATGAGGTATATVALANRAPAGLGEFAAGNAHGDPEGTNRTFVSVYSPRPLLGATLEGLSLPLESEVEGGANVYSAFVVIPPGGTRTLTVRLGTRGDAAAPRSLEILRQPLPNDDRVEVVAGPLRFGGPLPEDLLLTVGG